MKLSTCSKNNLMLLEKIREIKKLMINRNDDRLTNPKECSQKFSESHYSEIIKNQSGSTILKN
jgi:hypothetical protein